MVTASLTAPAKHSEAGRGYRSVMQWNRTPRRIMLPILGAAALVAAPASASILNYVGECVPFARAASGIQIWGDAWTWWSQAETKYQRGHVLLRDTSTADTASVDAQLCDEHGTVCAVLHGLTFAAAADDAAAPAELLVLQERWLAQPAGQPAHDIARVVCFVADAAMADDVELALRAATPPVQSICVLPGDTETTLHDRSAGHLADVVTEAAWDVRARRAVASDAVVTKDYDLRRPRVDLTAKKEAEQARGREVYLHPGGFLEEA